MLISLILMNVTFLFQVLLVQIIGEYLKYSKVPLSKSMHEPITSPGSQASPYDAVATFHFLTRPPSYAYEWAVSPTPVSIENTQDAVHQPI